MRGFTVNQIIILLECYRGTDFQKQIGTYKKDLMILNNRNLIDGNNQITDLGVQLCDKIKELSNIKL